MCSATALACGSGVSRADLRPIARQNVLLITIDTLRADALGCYGGPTATPALDRLAAEGIRFEFAHAHAVTTLSSHATILSGTYPFQHGIRDNSGYRLRVNARTAAALLKQAGYATAAFVGAFPLHSRFGLNQGFDVYDDRFGDTRAPDEFVMPERPAAAVVPLARAWIAAREAGRSGKSGGPGRSSESSESGRSSVRGGSSTSDRPGLLDPPDPPGQPWFVWLHVFDPHAPYRPPPPFDARYASQPYYGEVAAVDAAIAPLFDDLRAAGKPTLVIVTGDHGEALGDHGEQTHGVFAYESTLRIPLIVTEITAAASTVRLKPDRSGGTVASVSARHVDILPTLLEAIGLPVPADLPGRSLLTAAERADTSPRPSYFEAMSAMLTRGWAPLSGVLVDREKYIDLPIAERYDLAADPAERRNLAGTPVERDRTLAAALRGFSASMPGQRQAEDADAAARLRALGYVAGSTAPKARYTDADDPKTLIDVDRAVHDAVDAFTAGRAGEAVRLYDQVIARRPDMAIAYRHLAFIERQRGNVGVAIEVLQRAIKAGVRDPRVTAQLGEYLTEGGRMADGIRLLESVTRDSAGDLDALNALGIAYAQSGRADAARATFERVLAINPHSSVPLENLGLLALERGDVATARQQFERAAESDPRSSRAQSGLGNVALKAGDRSAAIDAWRRAVQLDPRNFDALYNLGTALARDGDVNGARPYLDQFLHAAPPAFYGKELDEVAQLLRR
ncbi:MAG TPA: sulfatase-like hydrolase/transferase [Vicinamibacterales bacterium]|nr:sulfatase-like hydrolase/transferase [Vicinamibacterales bacterium]